MIALTISNSPTFSLVFVGSITLHLRRSRGTLGADAMVRAVKILNKVSDFKRFLADFASCG